MFVWGGILGFPKITINARNESWCWLLEREIDRGCVFRDDDEEPHADCVQTFRYDNALFLIGTRWQSFGENYCEYRHCSIFAISHWHWALARHHRTTHNIYTNTHILHSLKPKACLCLNMWMTKIFIITSHTFKNHKNSKGYITKINEQHDFQHFEQFWELLSFKILLSFVILVLREFPLWYLLVFVSLRYKHKQISATRRAQPTIVTCWSLERTAQSLMYIRC